MITNTATFAAILNTAICKVAASVDTAQDAARRATALRWQVALAKAVIILTEWPLVAKAENLHGQVALLIRSEDSGDVYLASADECWKMHGSEAEICPALAYGQPCKHRAAALLLTRYEQAIAAAATVPAPCAHASAPEAAQRPCCGTQASRGAAAIRAEANIMELYS